MREAPTSRYIYDHIYDLYIFKLTNPLFSSLPPPLSKTLVNLFINNILRLAPCLSSSYPHWHSSCWTVNLKRVWLMNSFLAWVLKAPQIFPLCVSKAISPPLMLYLYSFFFFLKGLHPHLFLLNTTLLIFPFLFSKLSRVLLSS